MTMENSNKVAFLCLNLRKIKADLVTLNQCRVTKSAYKVSK